MDGPPVPQDIPPDLPLLLLCTADVPFSDLPPDVADLFSPDQVLSLGPPDTEPRRLFFRAATAAVLSRSSRKAHQRSALRRRRRRLEVLPKAPLSSGEARAAEAPARAAKEREEADRLALKMALWRVLNDLLPSREFEALYQEVSDDAVPGWARATAGTGYASLSQIRLRNDQGAYGSLSRFLRDVGSIPKAFDAFFSAHPSDDPRDGYLRSLAHHLRDKVEQQCRAAVDAAVAERCEGYPPLPEPKPLGPDGQPLVRGGGSGMVWNCGLCVLVCVP